MSESYSLINYKLVILTIMVYYKYNASKAAVKHMAASLGVEWAKKGIRVNCISPGYMATSLTQHILANAPDLRA